jgi:hypothetical protein
VLYDGDLLNITVNMAGAGLGVNSYYWNIDLYYDTPAANYITAGYYTFNASTPPTIDFVPVVPSTITTPSYEFVGTYVQAEGIMVKHFTINLYDSVTTQLEITAGTATPLLTSGETWLNNIRYTASGLINGISYQVQITGLTQQNVAFATVLTAFNVSYIVPNALTHPTATLNDDTSIDIIWNKIVSILGVVTGGSSYIANYLASGNYGLHLEAGAYAEFALDFSAPFTEHWLITHEAAFTGDFGEAIDTAGTNYAKFGYDGSRFYLNVNGNYYYDTAEVLTTNAYLCAIYSDGVTISFYHRELI